MLNILQTIIQNKSPIYSLVRALCLQMVVSLGIEPKSEAPETSILSVVLRDLYLRDKGNKNHILLKLLSGGSEQLPRISILSRARPSLSFFGFNKLNTRAIAHKNSNRKHVEYFFFFYISDGKIKVIL